MKSFVLIAALLVGANASANILDSWSEAEVRSAYKAARNDDLRGLRKLLTGKALEEFGTAEGLKVLRADLLKGKLSLRGEFISQDHDADKRLHREYEVTALAKGSDGLKTALRAFTLDCIVTEYESCRFDRDYYSVDCTTRTRQVCTIVDIAK